MMDNLEADPSCALCPQPGANCTAPGATLSRLLLMPGYWRRSNTSTAVLACAAHRRLEPASSTHPSRLEYTPPLLALSGAATRTAARTRVAAAAQRRAARGEAGLGSTAHSARRSRRGTVLPPCCTALHRASPASHAPWPFLKPLIPSPLSAASQYVDPLRNACVSCDDVQWSPTLPALLAMLALALAARRLVASSPPVARVANRAVRRVPPWMRPGLPHWMGTFQSVVYAKIVWSARTTPLTLVLTLRSSGLHAVCTHALTRCCISRLTPTHALTYFELPTSHPTCRTFIQIASTFDEVYRVSAPRNTRMFLNDIGFDGWGDPYGSFGMGTLFAPPHV